MTQVKNPLFFLFAKEWQYSEGNRKKVVLYWVMFVIGEFIALAMTPLVCAALLDTTSKEGVNAQNIRKLMFLLSLLVVRSMIFWSFHGTARVIERINAFRIRLKYREFLLKGILTMPLEWHAEHHTGDTIDKIEKGTSGLYDFSEGSYQYIYALIQLIVSASVLMYFSPWAAGVAFLMIGVSAWITTRFDRVLIPQFMSLNKTENKISASVLDAISNITTVIISRVEKNVFRAIMHKVEEPFELYSTNARITECKWAVTSFCCNSMIALVMGMYFWKMYGTGPGVMGGSTYILLTYLNQFGDLMFQFTESYGNVVKRRARVANAEEIAEDFQEESFANHVLPDNWRELEIRNLNFSYHAERQIEGEGDLHLKDVSLSLHRGERIAVVGATGGGKTTLLKVIRDLHHPRSLELSVDGVSVPDGFGGISRAIALIPQNPEIFSGSILGNLTVGADYSPESIAECIEMASFGDVVKQLPKGLDSLINEKGVNLSGGQKQRLALARGLLACGDKSIVLFDEPTSSLDAATEMSVYRKIFDGFGGKTILVSLHGLRLLPLFDRICMFKGGRIVGIGSLREMLDPAFCPEFCELWAKYHETKNKTLACGE